MSAETFRAPGGQRNGAGVIHDLGYRRYAGPRLGRPRIVAALAWHSFRSAFGFGRGARAKVVPAIACAVLLLPAVVNAFVMSQGGDRSVDYDTYVPTLRDLILLVFVAVQAPELVSRDLRSRVLPLYFSRPIRPADYPLAKYAGFTGAVLALIEVPVLALYAGTIANVHGGSAVWAQTRELIPGLLIGVLWAVTLAAVSLFLASLNARRGFATGTVAIALLLSYTLAELLIQIESMPLRHAAAPAPAVPFAEKVSGLLSPFTLLNGVRLWLGGTSPGDGVPPPGTFGAVYALVLVALVGLSLYGLAARYNQARLS